MSVHVPVKLRRQVRDHFANCCAYCLTAERLTVATFECEHIVPRSAGGETVLENLGLACPMCNRFKADRMVATDQQAQTEVALFHPHRDAWTDHFVWNEDRTEIVPLTATGRATIYALRMNRPQMIRVRRMWVAMGEHPPNLESPT